MINQVVFVWNRAREALSLTSEGDGHQTGYRRLSQHWSVDLLSALGVQTRTCLAVDELAEIAVGLASRHHLWERHAVTSSPSMREGLRLLGTDVLEAWLLRWPPGSSVQPHDHGGSNGALVVCRGELAEIRWTASRRRTAWLAAGDLATVPSYVVHDVISVGTSSALSIHVYSPPLHQMRFYDDDAEQEDAVEPVVEEPTVLDPIATAMVLDRPAHV
jgi:uncharacterized RmlC-like cupin family protein